VPITARDPALVLVGHDDEQVLGLHQLLLD